jgi:hypothetical protein
MNWNYLLIDLAFFLAGMGPGAVIYHVLRHRDLRKAIEKDMERAVLRIVNQERCKE